MSRQYLRNPKGYIILRETAVSSEATHQQHGLFVQQLLLQDLKVLLLLLQLTTDILLSIKHRAC